MTGLRDIKSKITANKSISKVFSVMQLIAASKMNAALQKARDSAANINEIRQMIARILEDQSLSLKSLLKNEVPVVENKKSGIKSKNLNILFTSDRGLCGNYNLIATRKLIEHLNTSVDDESMICIGNKGLQTLKRHFPDIVNQNVGGKFNDFLKSDDYIENLFETILEMYQTKQIDSCRVFLVYASNPLTKNVNVYTFLPGANEEFFLHKHHENPHTPPHPKKISAESEEDSNIIYEKSAREVGLTLLKLYLRGKFFSYFRFAHYSELTSRMLAMDTASKNSKDLQKKLTTLYNKKRQSMITNELIDIVSGAMHI